MARGAYGSSMIPLIQPGAVLIVQEGVSEIENGGLYIVLTDLYDEGVVVKRVFAVGDQLLIWSENPAYSPRMRYLPLDAAGEGGLGRYIRGKVVKIVEDME